MPLLKLLITNIYNMSDNDWATFVENENLHEWYELMKIKLDAEAKAHD